MSLKMQKNQPWLKEFLLIINKRQRLATQRRFAGSKKQSCSSGDKAEAAKYESGNANLYNCLHLKTPFKEQTVLTLVEQIEELQLQWQKIMKRCKPLLNQKPGNGMAKPGCFSRRKKELAFATFFYGSVESSHWGAISATLKQLDAVLPGNDLFGYKRDKFQLFFTRRSFLQKLRMFSAI